MDWNLLVTVLAGNIPAIIILWWVQQERSERIAERERHYRFMLALLGWHTDPDSSDVVRIKPDREVAPD